MAACSSNVSYPTDLEFDNLELDEYEFSDTEALADYEEMVVNNPDSDIDENAVTREEWVAAGKAKFRHSKIGIDIEDYKTGLPEKYERMMNLCYMAVTHYQNIRKRGAYKLVSLKKAMIWFSKGVEYTLTIVAANVKGQVETIEAVGLVRKGNLLEIVSCEKGTDRWTL